MMLMRNMEKSTFKPVTSGSSMCSVYYDQQSKRMQLLLCQDGLLDHEGELLVDDREKLDKYDYYLESEQRKLRREEKKDLVQHVSRALSAVDHIKRSLDALKTSEAKVIELDTLQSGQFAVDFLDENLQSLKKMGPFIYKDGFAQLTLSVEHNWKNVGAFIIRKIGNTQIYGPFQLTDNFDVNAVKNEIHSCRAAGEVDPKKIGSLQTSSNERYSSSRDRRTEVKNLLNKESDAGICKLITEFQTEDPDTGETKKRFYQGSGQILNMKLEDGAITKCFIASTAHNFLQVDVLDETKSWLVGCTAYLRMRGEKNFSKRIPVKRYKVYDRYVELQTKDLGFQGVDFAIAAIDINPKDVEVRTFDSRFSIMPTNLTELNPDLKPIEISITGYSDKEKNRFKPLWMDGTVNRVIKKKGDHALLVYDNLDTSDGTDGAAIIQKQSAGMGKYLGWHCGRSDGRSFGALLTQPVMSWIYDTVTSGEFWEGSHISPVQQEIGSWHSYDPYISNDYNLYFQQDEEEVEPDEANVWNSMDEAPQGPVFKSPTKALMTESHQLSKALIAEGYKLMSPVYSVQYPLLGDGCPFARNSVYSVQYPLLEDGYPFARNSNEDIRRLIFSFVGVKFQLTLPFTDVSQTLLDLTQFKHVKKIIQTIVEFLPSDDDEELYLAHIRRDESIEILSTRTISPYKITAWTDEFSKFQLFKSKVAICAMYEAKDQLNCLLCQQGYLQYEQRVMTTNDPDMLKSYKNFLLEEKEECNDNDSVKKTEINRCEVAAEHIEKAINANVSCITTSLAMNMLKPKSGKFKLQFFGDNDGTDLLSEVGTFCYENGLGQFFGIVNSEVLKECRSFKIIKYAKGYFFGTSELPFGPFTFKKSIEDNEEKEAGATPALPLSPIYTEAHPTRPIHLHYSTFYPVRSMVNCEDIAFEDFSYERGVIKKAAENSMFEVNMCRSVFTWESLLENPHILHIAGEGKDGYMTFENLMGGTKEIPLSGIPNEDADKILSEFDYERSTIQRKAVQTKLVLYFRCFSEQCGRALVALGFEHVICVKKGQAVRTAACDKFSQYFYNNLFSGDTIKKAFDKTVENLPGFDKVFILLPEDGRHDVNLQDLTGIAPSGLYKNEEIEISSATSKIPAGGDDGAIPKPMELHISTEVACQIIDDLTSYGCSIVHGLTALAREQMAQIIACQVYRYGHFQNGVFAIKFQEPIESRRDFIKQIVQCIHQTNAGRKRCLKVDDDGKSLLKFLKKKSVCLFFYSDSFGEETDWIVPDERVQLQIFRTLVELHKASVAVRESKKGGIFVGLTGNTYLAFRQFCETHARRNNPLGRYMRREDDPYLTDYIGTDEDQMRKTSTTLRAMGFSDAALSKILPSTTDIYRRLVQFDKKYGEEHREILELYLKNGIIHEDHPEAKSDLDNFATALEIRDEIRRYQAELSLKMESLNQRKSSSIMQSPDRGMSDREIFSEETVIFSEEEGPEEVVASGDEECYETVEDSREVDYDTPQKCIGAKQLQEGRKNMYWKWLMEFLKQNNPKMLTSEKDWVMKQYHEAFPNEDPMAFHYFLDDNAEDIEDRWLRSEAGRNKLLTVLHDTIRKDPKHSVTRRGTREEVGAEFANLYGIDENRVVEYILRPCPDMAKGLAAIRNGEWVPLKE